MKFNNLIRDPARAYAHPTLTGVRLVFRSNVDEPVIVTLDVSGNVKSEHPDQDIGDSLPDGWMDADPLPATGIVHDDTTYVDPVEQIPVEP